MEFITWHIEFELRAYESDDLMAFPVHNSWGVWNQQIARNIAFLVGMIVMNIGTVIKAGT